MLGNTKIIDNNTTLVQENGDVTGAFVDIDVYDKVPEGFLKHIDLFFCNRLLTINTGKRPENSINNKLRNFSLNTIISNRRLFLMCFQKIAELPGKYPPKKITHTENCLEHIIDII